MNETSSCCAGMKGFCGAFLATLFVGVGYYVGTQDRDAAFSLPPQFINATASDSGEEFSLATGRVSGDAEGLFVLDHATGQLQCYVMYPRTAKFGAVFSTNVGEALAGRGEKGAKYVMVTGDASFPGGGRTSPAGTVLYVLDTTSGAFVAYGLPFDRTMMTANRPQQGVLTPLDMGQVRQVAIRE